MSASIIEREVVADHPQHLARQRRLACEVEGSPYPFEQRRHEPCDTKRGRPVTGIDTTVSHAALYRFYPTKSAVMDAIAQEAMDDEEAMAARFLEAEGKAGDRLQAMILELYRRKRARFVGDREVHDLYRRILVERQDMIAAYAERMTRLIAGLVAQAVERGEWNVDDATKAAGVVRDAVTVYVHPLFVAQAVEAEIPVETLLAATLATMIRAFEAGIAYRHYGQ